MQQRSVAVLLAAVVLLAASTAQAQTGACCYCDGCVVVTAGECDTLGGEYQGDGSPCTALCTDDVNMPDPDLRLVVQAELGGCQITEFNMLSLTDLDAGELNVGDLTGLEYATNLINLDLEDFRALDISPLSGLISLETLNLRGNSELNDISPLEGLTNLTSLNMGISYLDDLSPLAGLTSLTYLDLNQGGNIIDISPLAGLTNLVTLNLWGNFIYDLSPLEGLVNLEWLNLSEEGDTCSDLSLRDLTPLGGLPVLTYLNLNGNEISDISPLLELTTLSDLDLTGNFLTATSQCAYIPMIIDNNPGVDLQFDVNDMDCDCLADLNRDGSTDILDFLIVIGNWGFDKCLPQLGDVDRSGLTDVLDFLCLLATWGPCPE